MSVPATKPAAVTRVMVVDDSVVARSMTARWLQEQPDFQVVAVCRTGREAVDNISWARPDVVVLDVEMPDMDGVEALPLLLRAREDLAIVMASSYTTRGADLSMRCLSLGAMDVIAKPAGDVGHPDHYRRELVDKVRALGDVAWRRTAAAARVSRGAANLASAVSASVGLQAVRAIAIGASTGGPQAIAHLLRSIAPVIDRVPVLIAQHMPKNFTAAFAGHIADACGVSAHEAVDGEHLYGGTVYVAPGGRHLTVAAGETSPVVRLTDDAPVNLCRPSVEPLFRSAADVYRSGLIAVVLTGMGADGAASVPVVAGAGGRVFAQDEATSVVWGMPGAAAATGACAAVLPLAEIGPRLARLIAGARA